MYLWVRNLINAPLWMASGVLFSVTVCKTREAIERKRYMRPKGVPSSVRVNFDLGERFCLCPTPSLDAHILVLLVIGQSLHFQLEWQNLNFKTKNKP